MTEDNHDMTDVLKPWTPEEVAKWLLMDDGRYTKAQIELATEAFNAGRQYQHKYGLQEKS